VRIEDVKVITVIGAGNMGHQIGTLCALHGFETYITDTNSAQLKKAQDFVASYLPGRVEKGRISQETADITSSLIHFEPNIELASQNADVIIEAVFEELELKRSIFTQLESICNSEVLFATNASRIPSSEIASVLNYPSRICNMHFFNPALVMKCVEVMRGDHTSDDAFELACALCEKLGKTPARLNKELNGMVGSRVAGAIFNECMAILSMGYATAKDIDSICRGALGHPMGPFELMDLTGVDMTYIALMDRYRESGDRNDLPWPLMAEMYARGEWGRKTGKGFYTYDDDDPK
jgi:3-hydroxybutyryl-CoA dehydrogenase